MRRAAASLLTFLIAFLRILFWVVAVTVGLWSGLSFLDVNFTVNPPAETSLWSYQKLQIQPHYLQVRLRIHDLKYKRGKQYFSLEEGRVHFSPFQFLMGRSLSQLKLRNANFYWPDGSSASKESTTMPLWLKQIEWKTISLENVEGQYAEKIKIEDLCFGKKPLSGQITLLENMPLASGFQLKKGTKFFLSGQLYPEFEKSHIDARGQISGMLLASGESLPIDDFTLNLSFSSEDALQAKLHFDLGQKSVLDFTIKALGSNFIRAPFGYEGKVTPLSLGDLNALWPAGLAQNARNWIHNNLSVGHIENLWVKGEVSSWREGLEPLSMNGGMKLKNMQVKYHATLPQIQGMDADVTFTPDHFDIRPTSGHIKGLDIHKGVILLKGLQEENQDGDVSLQIKGPLQDAFWLINEPGLALLDRFNFKPEDATGEAECDVRFQFPLLGKLTLDGVETEASAKMRKVTLHTLPGSKGLGPLTEGEFSLILKDHQLTLRGKGVAGDPLELTLTEDYRQKKIVQTLQAQATFETGKLLEGLELGGFVNRPEGSLKFISKDNNVDLTVTFKGGKILIPFFQDIEVSAEKPIVLEGGGPLKKGLPADKWSLKATQEEKLLVQGELSFAPEKGFSHFTLESQPGFAQAFKVEGHEKENIWDITASGKALNISPLLSRKSSDDDTFTGHARLRLEDALIGDRPFLKELVGDFSFQEGKIVEGSLMAKSGQEHEDAFTLTISQDDKERQLSIQGENFGRILSSLSEDIDLDGKALEIKAHKPLEEGQDKPWKGSFTVEDATIKKIPQITQLFRILTPFPMMDVMSQKNEYLVFRKLQGDFEFHKALLTFKETFGTGINISMTLDGEVDFEHDYLKLQGSVVPFSVLNTILSHIPIIGRLLTGGKGEGILGMNYSIEGPFSETKISSNPMSVLTPGIVRKFTRNSSKIDREKLAEEKRLREEVLEEEESAE